MSITIWVQLLSPCLCNLFPNILLSILQHQSLWPPCPFDISTLLSSFYMAVVHGCMFCVCSIYGAFFFLLEKFPLPSLLLLALGCSISASPNYSSLSSVTVINSSAPHPTHWYTLPGRLPIKCHGNKSVWWIVWIFGLVGSFNVIVPTQSCRLYFALVPHKVFLLWVQEQDVAVQADRRCDMCLVVYSWNWQSYWFICVHVQKEQREKIWMSFYHKITKLFHVSVLAQEGFTVT